jgi:hypothetical protein
MLHRRDMFAEHGGFDTSFRIAGDYDLLLRELSHRNALHVGDLVVARVRMDGVSRSPRLAAQSLREARRALLANGVRRSAPVEAYVWTKHWVKAALLGMLGERVARPVVRVVRSVGTARG